MLETKQERPSILVQDNFYVNPDEVRELALSQEFIAHPKHHKGKRTNRQFLTPGMKKRFEDLLGGTVTSWDTLGVNGCFQSCVARDELVYHNDKQNYAGAIFLTPKAPLESGTSFFRSKATGLRHEPTQQDAEELNIRRQKLVNRMYKTGIYDKTRWDLVDQVGNIYNRLILWNAKQVHAASCYFGVELLDSRLFQLFFFNME